MGSIIMESSSEFQSVEELLDKDISIEKNNKQKEYIEYIQDHVLNVQKAFSLFFLPLLEKQNICKFLSDEEFKNAINKSAINITVHDASKFSDEEFDGYREKYYPCAFELADEEFQKKVEERAEIAWVSHYKHNPHHPMYWQNEDNTFKDMQLEYIIEMICDWTSFNIKAGDPHKVIDWYNNEATHEKDEMTDKTKNIVEELLNNVIFN